MCPCEFTMKYIADLYTKRKKDVILKLLTISGQNVQHLNEVNCIAGVYLIKTNTCVHKKCFKK